MGLVRAVGNDRTVVSQTSRQEASHCCMVESADTAMGSVPVRWHGHDCDYGESGHDRGRGRGRDGIRSAIANAGCRSIVPASMFSGRSQGMADSASASVSGIEGESVRDGHGHDCGSLLKLAEHMMKPYLALSIDRASKPVRCCPLPTWIPATHRTRNLMLSYLRQKSESKSVDETCLPLDNGRGETKQESCS